ncbi:MAG TPA: hypothetical protein VEF89_00530 [Solirubrobacteraceae bacterium]|nr:hypothetical protein [Solirubrobacteraceae bacterium]
MSTTLVPPSYYVVTPRGQRALLYATVADAAAAIVLLAPTPATVTATTGNRSRSLSQAELTELGQRIRAFRLSRDGAVTVDGALTSALHRGRRARTTEPDGS